MGYYTYYSLTMIGEEKDIGKAKKDAKQDKNECLSCLLNEQFIEAKWYDFHTEFEAFAKKHPKVLFIVCGDGEEPEDLWEERFKGNQVEYHSVTMPPFTNPELLLPDEKENN